MGLISKNDARRRKGIDHLYSLDDETTRVLGSTKRH